MKKKSKYKSNKVYFAQSVTMELVCENGHLTRIGGFDDLWVQVSGGCGCHFADEYCYCDSASAEISYTCHECAKADNSTGHVRVYG